MKRIDVVLIIVLAAAAVGILIGNRLETQSGDTLIVRVHGAVAQTYSLRQNDSGTITGAGGIQLSFSIEQGHVSVIEANCPDKLCMSHRPISKNGESIICLPAGVILEIQSSEEAQYDAIVR